jgi:two-component system, sensor histidine kinase
MAVRWWRSAEGGGYLVAVLATAAATLLRLVLSGVLGEQAPFFPFVLAVLVAAWYGGLRPGLLATALGAVLGTYLSARPSHPSWAGRSGVALITGLFLVIGVAASWLCGALHAARRRTEEKQRQLAHAEEQTRSVVDTVIDGIITIDERGVVQSFNPAAERLFGYPASEVIGQNVKVLMPEPYRHEHDKYLAHYLRTGEAKVIGIGREVVGRREDGSTFPMELAVSEFRLGERRQVTGIVRDITERKLAEEALRRSEAQFRQLADSLPQIVWTARPDGYLDYYNERWYEYTGFPRGQYGEASWVPILHPDDVRRCKDTYYGCIKSGRPYQIEYRFKDRATGGYRWFLGRAFPVRDGQARIVRWFGTCTDIDDTKRAEEALQEADRRKDEFLATLAHELRNPLAPLRNAVELLRRAGGDAGLMEQARTMMERQLGQMVRLVDDLLDLSRIAAGKLRLRRERVGLEAVLRSAVEAARPLVEAQAHD